MVTWTAHAKGQVTAIYDYIAQDSPFYAKRTAETLIHSTIGLEQTPKKGRKIPELNDANLRELSVSSYRVLYEIKADEIQVLAVIHKRRDLTKINL